MAWAVLAAGMIPCPAVAEQQDAALRVTGPEVLVAAPDNTTGVFGWLRYSRHAGTEMLLTYHTERAGDVADEGYGCRVEKAALDDPNFQGLVVGTVRSESSTRPMRCRSHCPNAAH